MNCEVIHKIQTLNPLDPLDCLMCYTCYYTIRTGRMGRCGWRLYRKDPLQTSQWKMALIKPQADTLLNYQDAITLQAEDMSWGCNYTITNLLSHTHMRAQRHTCTWTTIPSVWSVNDLATDRKNDEGNTATEHSAASYLWYIVVLQGNVEVRALLFSGLLCAIAHLAGQHRRTGASQ